MNVRTVPLALLLVVATASVHAAEAPAPKEPSAARVSARKRYR